MCERDGVVLREGETELADDVDAVATGLVARNGAGSVEVLAEHFSDDPDAARLVLEAQNDVVWLDDRREWFLVRGARSPLTNMLRKMLSVAGSLSLADVDDGLRRAFRPVLPSPRRPAEGVRDDLVARGRRDAHRHLEGRARRDPASCRSSSRRSCGSFARTDRS